MVRKVDQYRQQLRGLTDWTPFLRRNSGLPGPRGNLELARAFAEEASASRIEQYLKLLPDEAPENTAEVFLVFCAITALGMRLHGGDTEDLARLRALANDKRWRIREAVAIGLQYYGDHDVQDLVQAMRSWAHGSWYEKRAAIAALAEPRLLQTPEAARAGLLLIDQVTRAVESAKSPREDAFMTVRKTLGYGWSVGIVADPETGKPLFEKWLGSENRDIRWILRIRTQSQSRS